MPAARPVARRTARMASPHLTGLPVVWSEDCLRHEPAGEGWLGVREPGPEVPERATVLLAALTQAGAAVTDAPRRELASRPAVPEAEPADHPASDGAQR